MKKLLLVGWLILLGSSAAYAEQVTLNYTEPIEAGTLAYTTVYWCRGATCTNYTYAGKRTSDNGNGGDAQSVAFAVPLTAGTLPLTIRIKATATNTSGNEGAGATTTRTFN